MIEKMEFGKTGHKSTRTLFGAAAFSNVSQIEADRTMETIFNYGVNHIDTAASYGESEKRLGPWIKKHRKDFFLATKTEMRTKKEALEELYRSFDNLQTDSVDLWQMHVLIDQNEWETAMRIEGAIEAFMQAKSEGLVKFIGVTGHELIAPVMHLKSLKEYDFDSVLLPYNYILMQNAEYKKNFDTLYEIAMEKNIAFQCIKTICRRPWGVDKQNRATWYQPFENQNDIDAALGWAFSKRGTFINTPADINILPMVLEAAEKYNRNVDYESEMVKVAERTEMAPLFV